MTPVGELDLDASRVLDRRLRDAQTSSRWVVLDLRALEFIDSSGLGSIVAARLRAVKWRHHLKIICGGGPVRRMLTLSGHEPLLQITEATPPQGNTLTRAA